MRRKDAPVNKVPHLLTLRQPSTIVSHQRAHTALRQESLHEVGVESMLQRRTALAVIVALSLVIAACGGSSEEATGEAASGESGC